MYKKNEDIRHWRHFCKEAKGQKIFPFYFILFFSLIPVWQTIPGRWFEDRYIFKFISATFHPYEYFSPFLRAPQYVLNFSWKSNEYFYSCETKLMMVNFGQMRILRTIYRTRDEKRFIALPLISNSFTISGFKFTIYS